MSTPAADPKAGGASPASAPPAPANGAGNIPPPATTSTAPAASVATTPAPVPPGSSGSPAEAAPDKLPELVRIAKAERNAAKAIKDAEAKTTALAALQAKETQFNELVGKGNLLDAARLYFPKDEQLADKLFWQLTDYVAQREDAKEPTVEELVDKKLADAKAAEKAETDKKAEEKKTADVAAAEKKLSEQRAAYFGEASKALAADPTSFPLVTAKILLGEITQDEIAAHVEAIGDDIFKLGLPDADLTARIREETAPANILAALEAVLRAETAAPAPAAVPGAAAAAGETLEQITEAAIASATATATKRMPPTTISSAAVQGAPPVVPKKPEEMTLDELDAYSIAEAERRHGAPAAR